MIGRRAVRRFLASNSHSRQDTVERKHKVHQYNKGNSFRDRLFRRTFGMLNMVNRQHVANFFDGRIDNKRTAEHSDEGLQGKTTFDEFGQGQGK